MKIAFPTQDNKGLESPVYGHFGSARFFIVVNQNTLEFEVIENQDRVHIHGKCNPLSSFRENTISSVVVGGIGAGALNKLNNSGIITYRAVEGTISENLDLLKIGKLPKFDINHTCIGHSITGQCAH
ncbi:MAG: NifB/NifX family molybdenum-iron cluster-binding protein [Desulfobacterales bacterium]|nr:NifB/NifX family molybdenum-iron cluster-binding protein [Desulfobacterales bacterium]